MSNCQQPYGLDKNNIDPRVVNFKFFSKISQKKKKSQQDFHIKPRTSGIINIRVLIAVLSHLYQRNVRLKCPIFALTLLLQNGAPCAHRQGICWWTCTRCCIHAVKKFGSQFSKLDSRSEYFITIRNSNFQASRHRRKVTNSKECSHVSFHIVPHVPAYLQMSCLVLFLVIYSCTNVRCSDPRF